MYILTRHSSSDQVPQPDSTYFMAGLANLNCTYPLTNGMLSLSLHLQFTLTHPKYYLWPGFVMCIRLMMDMDR